MVINYGGVRIVLQIQDEETLREIKNEAKYEHYQFATYHRRNAQTEEKEAFLSQVISFIEEELEKRKELVTV